MKKTLSIALPLVIALSASGGAQTANVTKFDVAGIPVIHKPVMAN